MYSVESLTNYLAWSNGLPGDRPSLVGNRLTFPRAHYLLCITFDDGELFNFKMDFAAYDVVKRAAPAP